MSEPWWEIGVRCDPRLVALACIRMRRLDAHGALINVRRSGRTLRFFLPVEITHRQLLQFALTLEEDARQRGVAAPAVSFKKVEHAEWIRPWRPFRVGRLFVEPANSPEPDFGRPAIRLLPRYGFGTSHITTKYCLEALERRLAPGDAVADIGCGSGVLAIAAMRLGAARVDAVDLDPVAVETAKANRGLNGIRPDQLRVETGGFDALVALGAEAYACVVCNTNVPVLEELVPRFNLITRAGSWAVVSGFHSADAKRMVDLFGASGWSGGARRGREDWCVVEASR